VVHCAALTRSNDPAEFGRVNTEGTIALARQAAAAGVRRFVFISSLTVNGRSSKDRPFRPDDRPDPQTPYSVSKLDAECGLRALAETGLEVAIIRPPRIVWPEASGNLALLARLVRKGVPLPFDLVDHNRRDNVSPESILSLVRLCLDHPAAAGETFLVADGAPLSTRELLVRIGRLVGRRPRLLPVPRALLQLIVAMLPARLLGGMSRAEMWDELYGSLELDVSRTRELLGWRPTPSALASAGQ
jgi:nucleoside-diphosphate-sugar epimerase